MARLKSTLQITGGINGLSFYTIKGGDTVYVRTKGGPSAKQLKVGEEFAVVRKHQVEWSACVMFSRALKDAMGDVYKFADFNVSPVWNGLGKKIMALDTEHPLGERSLRLTQCREWLAGYNLNKNFPFNSVFRGTLQLEIDKAQQHLTVMVPRINPSNDLYNVRKLPYFRFVFSLGFISDFVCYPEAKYQKYASANGIIAGASQSILTDWFSAADITDGQTIDVVVNTPVKEENRTFVTFIASAGIQFGTIGLDGSIEAVKNACCGKIMITEG